MFDVEGTLGKTGVSGKTGNSGERDGVCLPRNDDDDEKAGDC